MSIPHGYYFSLFFLWTIWSVLEIERYTFIFYLFLSPKDFFLVIKPPFKHNFPHLTFSYLYVCITVCISINYYIKSFVQWGMKWVNEEWIWIWIDGWLLVPEKCCPNRHQYNSPTNMHSSHPLKDSFCHEIQSLKNLIGKLAIIFLIQWKEGKPSSVITCRTLLLMTPLKK